MGIPVTKPGFLLFPSIRQRFIMFPCLCCLFLLLFHLPAFFGQMTQDMHHIFGSQFIHIPSVVHRTAVGLLIQLKQGTSQRGFPTSAFSHQTKGLPFIDIQGYIVVCPDIQPFSGKYTGLFYREILLQMFYSQ